MEKFKGLTFAPFTKECIPALIPIMKRSFDEDTRIHIGGEGGPPGYDNGDFLREWYLHEGVTAFTISKNGTLIGAMALWINENNINYLGNVFLDPGFQGKGLGTIIWQYAEQKYPATVKWQTDTPAFSKRNHHFYVNKCRFQIYRIENPKSNGQDCAYHMEKVLKRG